MARPSDLDEPALRRVRQLLRGGRTGGKTTAGWVPDEPSQHAAQAEVSAQVRAWTPEWPGRGEHPRVLTVPSALASGRVRVRVSAVAALVAVAVLAGVFFSVRVALAARSGEPVPIAPGRGALVSRSVPPAFSAVVSTAVASTAVVSSAVGEPAATGAPAVGELVIHVVGEVARPGVVRVGAGARVIDAITAAGGALPSADLKRINLARLVADAEQVQVPAPGEALLPIAGGSFVGPLGSGPAATPGSGRVNLNTADSAALDTLPGVGPVLAQRIIDWRTEHGRFTSVDELGEVSGIGEKLLAQLTPKVAV